MDFEPLLEINQKNNADTTEKEQEENNSKTKLEQLEDLKRELSTIWINKKKIIC